MGAVKTDFERFQDVIYGGTEPVPALGNEPSGTGGPVGSEVPEVKDRPGVQA